MENGQVAGGLAYLGDSIKLANFVINFSIINDLVTKGLNYGDLTTQAFSELTEGIANVARVVAVLRENPGRVGTELLDSAAEYLKALSHGYSSPSHRWLTVTQIAIDAALAAVGGEIGAAERGGAKVAGAVAEVGEEAGIRILRQGGDVVEVGVREIDVSSTTIVVDMEKVIEGSRRPTSVRWGAFSSDPGFTEEDRQTRPGVPGIGEVSGCCESGDSRGSRC